MNQQEVFDAYQPLLTKISSQFARKFPHYTDDIKTAGMMSLWDVSLKYDLFNNRNKFIPFASVAIKNGIMNVINRLNPTPRSLYKKIKDGEHHDISHFSYSTEDGDFLSDLLIKNDMYDDVYDPCDMYIQQEKEEYLKKYTDVQLKNSISKLNPIDKDIVISHLVEGTPMPQVAEKHNLSKQRCHQRKALAITEIKASLKKKKQTKEAISFLREL